MKKNPLLLYSCLLMAFFTFQSCSKKGSSNNVPTPAVKLSLNKTTITADGWETVTFTAKDENDIDITNSCTFSVNSTNVSGNTWWTSTAGSCSVKATKSGVSSTTQTLTATDAGVSPFSQKVIIFRTKHTNN